MLFLCAVFLGPFIYMLWLSFTNLSFATPEGSGEFIGIENYARAFSRQSTFMASSGRSLLFAALCVFPQVVIGLLFAELFVERERLQRWLSPILILPLLLPSVVVGLYWRLLLQGEFGPVSHYLAQLGFAGARGVLSSPETILVTLALIDLWQWGPFVCFFLLTARGALSKPPLEAAWADGASRIRAFFDVTLRRLAPAIFTVALIRAIESFKEFDKVYVLTGGGPGTASELVSLHVWRVAFKYWDFGYAAALCVILYLITYVAASATMPRLRAGVLR
ncbi:Inner membrane ABC transporter permease protein YcjO [Phycisphaerae bacterium RAS1]|nr:Inner membrane ABC transporter permease protein YcjO [Phycisphaerae bacterium RAS1]